jgi:hypothetical protein
MSLPTDRPLAALNRVLRSIESVRNGGALYVLLVAFSGAGLLLAMAESSLARDASLWAMVEGGLALTVAFYGSNAAGLLVMDEARGLPPREVAEAVREALTTAHRLVVVLVVAGGLGAALVAAVLALVWASRIPVAGPWLFGVAVPVGVVALGALMLAMVGVVGPLAAPATWRGLGVKRTLAFLQRQVRRRLVFAALLNAAVGLVAAAVAGLVSVAVVTGGRAVALMAVTVAGIDLPPQQLMAGLFGFGLRSLGAAGAPVAQSPFGAAALIGGGLVFAFALVLPGVVYLRGLCSAFLSLEEADALHEASPTP